MCWCAYYSFFTKNSHEFLREKQFKVGIGIVRGLFIFKKGLIRRRNLNSYHGVSWRGDEEKNSFLSLSKDGKLKICRVNVQGKVLTFFIEDFRCNVD